MAPKYLCCLPLRLGVLLISFINFLASAVVSGALAALLILDAQGKDHFTHGDTTVDVHLTGKYKYAAIAVAVVYGLVAIISLTGFIGAIRKSESMVRVFSALCKFFLALQVAVSVAAIILSIVNKDELKKLCIGDSTNQSVIDACNNFAGQRLWSLIVGSIVPLIFQAYGVYIIAAYARKLRMDDESAVMYRSGPGYVKVAGEEAHPLTAPSYPHAAYSDASHKV
ncbi:hypothetical protein C8F01DRAFT_254838 [Mycena amicta]|nr:hypothetical protein C8F01DRAFT_254838 [Mycena amicta]